MLAKVQKWGNSQGVRIPKSILENANISTDEELEIKVVDGRIILEPVQKHLTLKQRLLNYHGEYQSSEWDTGNPRGREVL
ncbi:MAG TPA: AbrB/MazE/SpoVT family DNA-binding domain-containing protein [Fusibacter sp.]|nr:AbrB/MazE/SpoVT family DNA-binding domain-containing protein [Fusibacter sp.]